MYPPQYYPQQGEAALGRSAAADELQRAFPSCRALNTERSALDLPIEIQPGRQTALRITMPPMFPQERPTLTVLVPVNNPAVGSGGRVRVRALDEWDARTPGKASLVAAVREALAVLLRPAGAAGMDAAPLQGPPPPLAGPSPRPPMMDGGAPSPSSSSGGGQGLGPLAELEALPTAELEKLLTDDEAFRRFTVAWIQKTPAAKAIEQVQQQNVALAQENLAMQGAIEEARNHVAIVRSSEFATVKSRFDELYSRQEAVLAKLSPQLLYGKLKAEADRLDEVSSDVEDRFLQGSLTVEQFVEQYLQQRIEYHRLDMVRQAAEYTGAAMPTLTQRWVDAAPGGAGRGSLNNYGR